MAAQVISKLMPSGAPARDKFIARLLGIVSEEIVAAWCRSPNAPYENLGRPRLRARDGSAAYTLDFTLRRRSDGQVFVAELKCETEYRNYRYLTLREPEQLDHHSGGAFRHFLAFAREPDRYDVLVSGQSVDVAGAVLIWGEVSEEGRHAVRAHCRFSDVLSLSDMIADLNCWSDGGFQSLLANCDSWSRELWGVLGLDGR